MVNRCSAYGCRSGNDKNTNSSISFHKYPIKNKELLRKWLKNNPRKNFIPTRSSTLCSLHFTDWDFITECRDSNDRRRKKRVETSLQRRYLKSTAVPTLFPNAPAYLSHKPIQSRNTTATSEARREKVESRVHNMEADSLRNDRVSEMSLDDIKKNLENEMTPVGYIMFIKDEKLFICLIRTTETSPNIDATIIIEKTYRVKAFVQDCKVEFSNYSDIVSRKFISTLTEIKNLMARIKNLVENQVEDPSLKIDKSIVYLRGILDLTDFESEHHRKLMFIIEQLSLLQKDKFHRHYSPELSIFSFIIYSNSSIAYAALYDQQIISIPSISTLRKIVRSVDSKDSLKTSDYLKLRASQLNE